MKLMVRIITVGLVLLSISIRSLAQNHNAYMSFEASKNGFPLCFDGKVPAILVDTNDYKGVLRAANSFQQDLKEVTGQHILLQTQQKFAPHVIIAGTIGKNKWIDALIAQKKIDVSGIKDSWEGFQIQSIDAPFKGVSKALVIVGADKRGTIFGMYDISEKMGVSPWHWWADVPVKQHNTLYIRSGIYKDAPKVKYRGIFINDEAPCLANWTKEKNGGFNHLLYEKVFELLLRSKANYLWPAMWGNTFQVDDPMNPVLADEYGVVIGTSHHEPMMRAHDEWRRYGKKGAWNYAKNDSTLRAFWRESMQERYKRDNIVTVGMRGDGDEPMSEGTAISLLEKIIADQRTILEDVSGKKASEIPQIWALYKEVQDYYDKGMRVPEDITLLLCDDNWGNIRRLPDLDEKPRKGGYGIYYHFDYVGGPRNYKWVNTNLIPRIWEQMRLAYEHKANQLWIVNVGDIKPMELPTSFFLEYAWNPEKWTADNINTYHQVWAVNQFGEKLGKEIGECVADYSKFNARVKPELLNAQTYSLTNYDEFERVVKEYQSLRIKSKRLYSQISPAYQDAFYQLVMYPIEASCNLYEMYYAQALNHQYAKQGNPLANVMADSVTCFFKKDEALSTYFNTVLAKGKWNHFADQTHIGYTYWQQPEKNSMPTVMYISEGTPRQPTIESVHEVAKTIVPTGFKGFVEADGVISIEAEHFSRKVNSENIVWKTIPNIGRTAGGVSSFIKQDGKPLTKDKAHLEYDVYLTNQNRDSVSVQVYLSPTLAFNDNKGLSYGISIDNDPMQVVKLHDDLSMTTWEKRVATNSTIMTSRVGQLQKGKHTLRLWAIDPNLVFQKIVLDAGGLRPSYLGPPESKRVNN